MLDLKHCWIMKRIFSLANIFINIKNSVLQTEISKKVDKSPCNLIEFIETNGDLEEELEGVFKRDEIVGF